MKTLLTLVIITASSAALYAVWKPPVHSKPKAIHFVEESPPPALGRVPINPSPRNTSVDKKPAKGRVALLECIRRYEQGRDGYATDTGNGFKGAYQFTESAWRANFGDRSPSEVSPEEQDALALNYISRRGLQPWPVPSRRCR